MSKRRTQAQRRQATQASLLKEARFLFGEKGYAHTSLDEVAEACGITVRPIYHYFGSKLGLFTAVTQQIERESIEKIKTREDATLSDIWSGFMTNCEDPHFRQILLIDAPNILGQGRVTNGVITIAAREESAKLIGADADDLTMSLLFGALSSAALYIAEHGATAKDYDKIRRLIEFHSKRGER